MTEYYNQETDKIFKKFNSNLEGLSSSEAKKRIKTWGKNSLPYKSGDSLLKIFFRQFKSPLIYVLLGAVLLVLALGEFIDASVIIFVLILNSVVGTIQEGKAQKTFLALRKFAKTRAVVLRDNQEISLSDESIVPGDVVIVREGEKIPADGRLVSAIDLKINESSLTGESFPVIKTSNIINKKNVSVSDQENMAFRGSSVVSGSGILLVTATGTRTQIGKIAKDIKMIDSEMPLKENIKKISKIINFTVLFLVIFLFILSFLSGKDLRETFLTSIALAVSIIPEGLPVVLTLTLALGIKRMSQINVLVKRMQAVEVLGQTKVLAVDKTGTITKNELMVRKFLSEEDVFDVDGQGYEPEGKILYLQKEIDPLNHEKLLLAGKVAVFCSNSYKTFHKREKKWKIFGDPTEAAMSVFAEKIGFKKETLLKEMPRVSEIPFDYEKRIHVSVNRGKEETFVSGAGAPENIIELAGNCFENGKILKFDKQAKEKNIAKFHELSQKGFRVLALAYFSTEKKLESFDNWDDMIFLGFLGIKDQLREDVPETIEKFREAGLKTIMITGDFEITAREIAREAGIYQEDDEVISGKDLQKMKRKELLKKMDKVSVFARVSPQDKLKIIKAFKKKKMRIAMTGDGVNDALSLVAADLGISMGKIGTEVAKEASDIVFLDDKFKNILEAFLEGRHIFNSIKRVTLFLISTSLGEVVAIFGALVLGFPMILTAVQIIWLNLVTDGFLDITLAMEPKRKKAWKKLKKFNYKFWDKSMTIRTALMSGVMGFFTILVFSKYWQEDIVKAMSLSLTVLAAFQWFNAWNCRYRNKSIFSAGFFRNKFLILATIASVCLQFLVLEVPFLQKIFKTTSLSFGEWMMSVGLAFSIIIFEEGRKFFYRIKEKK